MTAEEWLEVSRERALDAGVILSLRPDSIGSVYLAGYVIECSLKAFLQAAGKKVPTSGSAGHNLVGLWKATGLQKSILGGSEGSRTFFLEQWSTAMRYSVNEDLNGQSPEDLIDGAKLITGWFHQQVRRRRQYRRRR